LDGINFEKEAKGRLIRKKVFDVGGRDEVDKRLAKWLFRCGIPFRWCDHLNAWHDEGH
jgi:hypothetical protein